MKVCLVALNASYMHTSLAIRCLRGPLEENGFAVSLVEKNIREKYGDILEAIYREKADIYGFSCYIWNIEEMQDLACDLKSLLPASKILFGGPEASFDTERFSDTTVDCVIRGEGEKAIVTLCKMWERGETPPFTFAESAEEVMGEEGICYREGDTPEGSLLYYESSRGCPYHCAYCLSSTEKKLRMKSSEQTLADLEAFEKLPEKIKIIKFVDRTFNADVARANKIWRALLSEKYTRNYHFEICAGLLNEESFEIFAAMPKGKIQLEIGLQSTNRRTLEEVARQTAPEQVIAAARRIHNLGNIHVHLDLIAGLPYEGYDSFRKSFDDAYGSCDMLQLGFLKLLRGTELRRNAEKYGYIYQQKAPYTVLQSHWITYEELSRLEQIADLTERYDAGGAFRETLTYILPHVASPFAFYEGLMEKIAKESGQTIRRLSQNEAFRFLYQYALEAVPGLEEGTLQEKIHEDYKSREKRGLPLSVFGERNKSKR